MYSKNIRPILQVSTILLIQISMGFSAKRKCSPSYMYPLSRLRDKPGCRGNYTDTKTSKTHICEDAMLCEVVLSGLPCQRFYESLTCNFFFSQHVITTPLEIWPHVQLCYLSILVHRENNPGCSMVPPTGSIPWKIKTRRRRNVLSTCQDFLLALDWKNIPALPAPARPRQFGRGPSPGRTCH